VARWGDTAHRTGGCLVNMGCRGPRTHSNCSVVKWMGGVCWPVASGHGCIGCTEPRFWDTMFPYYSKPLPHDD
jgi:Ni,Fe-hydrogenase I small subunit